MKRRWDFFWFKVMIALGAVLFPALSWMVAHRIMPRELAVWLLDPMFTWSQSVAAGATFNPLDGWQYEYLPYPCKVEIFHRATLTGMLATVTSGSDTLMEEAPVSAGGTAGVTPGRLNIEPLTDDAAAGDRLKIRYRNTNAGANTIDGQIIITPLIG